MATDQLRRLIDEALSGLESEHVLPEGTTITFEIERPERIEHGDFSTNVAMVAAKHARMAPRQFADSLIARIPSSDLVVKTDVAGPGFINFFLSAAWLEETVKEIVDKADLFGRSSGGAGTKVQVEFVSANPTGPLHVGSGRNAAYGDALARLLEWVGFDVSREYYLNDTGNQVRRFALSLEARYQQALGRDVPFPEDGYQGEYLIELGKELAAKEGMGLINHLDEIAEWGIAKAVESHKQTLARFGILFDSWFSEKSLHESGKVAAAIDKLREKDAVYEQDGAVWFKATAFGASRDQPLLRSDEGGTPTYLAADVAYLIDKADRGFDKAIYVWGADHHGNYETLIAAAKAIGLEDVAEILLYQLVNFSSGGEATRMGRRLGNIITLDQLMDEVGTDAARYTFCSRSIDNTIDFDMEAVKKESPENPVYYLQYQHARICSILRYAEEQSIERLASGEVNLALLTHESERFLMRKLGEFPELIESSAKLRAPFRLTHYALALAGLFSNFYRDCRVLTEEADLTQARLMLADATRQVLANTFGILGITAPERM